MPPRGSFSLIGPGHAEVLGPLLSPASLTCWVPSQGPILLHTHTFIWGSISATVGTIKSEAAAKPGSWARGVEAFILPVASPTLGAPESFFAGPLSSL